MIKQLLLLLIFSLTLLLQGCDKPKDVTPATSDQASAPPPAKAAPAPLPPPTPATPEMIAKGKNLYQQNCVFCHQADAIGKPGFAPSLTNPELLSVASPEFMKGTIRDGRAGTGMPPFAHLGKSGIDAIYAYLNSYATLPNVSDKVNKQPHTQGDPRLGKLWYDQICTTCHGPEGDGYIAGGTGTAIGKPGFLGKASDGFIRTTIKQGRSNTRMIGYDGPASMAALSDKEIDDIISYLRSLPNQQ
jgi:cytochrome c oxidase cbb3-type subunit 3